MGRDKMYVKAYGKVNLGLDVLRRREDGYHEVKMIMQTVSIYDGLDFEKTDSGKIEIESNVFFVPTDESNLIYKAAKLLFDEYGIASGLKITLKKFIPVSAGMAGGSTDAAATLFAVNRMFDLKLSLKQLMEYGVKLGADIPYCLMRGTALSEGIGEKLTRLPNMVQCPVLIAKPPVNVSTKFVYENLHIEQVKAHPDIDGMIEAIKEQDIDKIAAKMGNVLENVTVKEYPQIQELKQMMMDTGAINAMMSGSGPTVFGLYRTEEEAYKAKEIVKGSGIARQVYVTDMFLSGDNR